MKRIPLPLILLALFAANAQAATLRVSVNGPIPSIAEAARQAHDGDVVEIAKGDYRGDVAVWTQKRLTIRGEKGTRLIASGMAAEQKGIFVIRGDAVVVENLEFRGAKVPDRNGAGIRLEQGSLKVVGCRFLENENGILTANNDKIEVDIENSEFGYNGAGDGQSHNLYVGKIARLKVTGSYFHHAKIGHLLKSRARENLIAYNRLSDETDGRASYELEFPNGGVAKVIGNFIEQSSATDNFKMLAYGMEGYVWTRNELAVVFNTFVDDRPQGGRMLDVKPGPVRVLAANNILVGKSPVLDVGTDGRATNNSSADWPEFVLPQRDDYRLRVGSRLLGKAQPVDATGWGDLTPTAEYVHPLQVRAVKPRLFSPGAYQTPADAR